jgi:hypothetical protein
VLKKHFFRAVSRGFALVVRSTRPSFAGFLLVDQKKAVHQKPSAPFEAFRRST